MSLTVYSYAIRERVEEYIMDLIKIIEYILEQVIIPTTTLVIEEVIEVKQVIVNYVDLPSWYYRMRLACIIICLPKVLESILLCVRIYKEAKKSHSNTV